MSKWLATHRLATGAEVIAHRIWLAELARSYRLGSPRVDATGVVSVHSDEPGYHSLRRFATEASGVVGAWVNVITDDVPAAQVDTQPL